MAKNWHKILFETFAVVSISVILFCCKQSIAEIRPKQAPQNSQGAEKETTAEKSEYVYVGFFLDKADVNYEYNRNRVYCHAKKGQRLWCSDPSKVPSGLGPLDSFEVFHNYLACAIQVDGSPLCWNPQTMSTYAMKPSQKSRFVKVVATLGFYDQRKFLCAWGLTEDGKIDHFDTPKNFERGSGYGPSFTDDFNSRFSAKDIAIDYDPNYGEASCGLFIVTTDDKPVRLGDLSEKALKNAPVATKIWSFPANYGRYYNGGFCFANGDQELLNNAYCPILSSNAGHAGYVRYPTRFKTSFLWEDDFEGASYGGDLKQCGLREDGSLECFGLHYINGSYPIGKSIGNLSLYGTGEPSQGYLYKACVPTQDHIECIGVSRDNHVVEVLPYGYK